MARPLRVLVPGGWCHVTSRANRRSRLFLGDADRLRFLSLLAEIPERFRLEVHSFVLMDNHYHLLVRTPEPSLSHAVRWLNVSGRNGNRRRAERGFRPVPPRRGRLAKAGRR